MEVLALLEMYVHVHLDGQEQDAQVSNSRLVDIEKLENNLFLTFQHQQPVQLAILDKQEQVHVSISR